MSFSSLIEILRNQSKIVSDDNASLIHLNIISQAGHRIVHVNIDITLVQNLQQNKVVKCVICDKICLCPIVFPCGHVICACYYVRQFKLINYPQFNSY